MRSWPPSPTDEGAVTVRVLQRAALPRPLAPRAGGRSPARQLRLRFSRALFSVGEAPVVQVDHVVSSLDEVEVVSGDDDGASLFGRFTQ